MGFFGTIRSAVANTFSIAGTASRRDFWYWIFFVTVILGIATIIDGAVIGPARGYLPFEHEAGNPLAATVFFLALVPTISLAVRRLHDSGWSGWWLLSALTVIGIPLVVFLLIKGGKKAPNRYLQNAPDA